jgi:uncharacterized protein YjbI with pentapeptide repeats
MKANFSQIIVRTISIVVCLVFILTFSLFNQPNANALIKSKETNTLPSGITTNQTQITPAESRFIPNPTKYRTLSTQESVLNNIDRLLKTNECIGCNLVGASLKDMDLQGANLQGANLQGADLERANLQKTNLSGANLQGADLGKTNIAGANLEAANLFDADLEKANLEGTNLEAANLRGADLEDAILPVGTIFR